MREFYDVNGRLAKTDSGIWSNSLDYSGTFINLGPKAFDETPATPCNGTWCAKLT